MTDKIFFLQDTNHLDIQRDAAHIVLSCGTYLTLADAEQLLHGLMAVLQGGFDRATSEQNYLSDLQRRLPAQQATAAPSLRPTLDML